MNRLIRRRLALLLAFALCSGLVSPPPAAAAEDDEATNLTLGVGVVIAVVVAVLAWHDEFGDDDDMITKSRDLRLTPPADDRLALVLTDWHPAEEERAELISGLGLRAWF